GRIVESAVWASTGSRARGMRAAGWSGRIIVILLFLGGVLFPFLRTGELSILSVVIVVMVGLMLWQAASATIKTAEAQLVADKMRLTNLMTQARTIIGDASMSMVIPY